MSLFGKILEKLGYKPADTPAAPASKPSAPAKASYPTGGAPKPVVARGPAAIRVVDVVGKPKGLAAKNPQKLDWKVSMVDLLKLLGLESSFEARKELAAELGCPADKMGDSASMNVWLHKTVLQKLADNGGNIPKELLS